MKTTVTQLLNDEIVCWWWGYWLCNVASRVHALVELTPRSENGYVFPFQASLRWAEQRAALVGWENCCALMKKQEENHQLFHLIKTRSFL
jgi:hypothetical protein